MVLLRFLLDTSRSSQLVAVVRASPLYSLDEQTEGGQSVGKVRNAVGGIWAVGGGACEGATIHANLRTATQFWPILGL